MKSVSDMSTLLAAERKQKIIELYLQEKFKAQYDPTWLNNPGNYAHLSTAIDYFHAQNLDNLNLYAMGSDNATTRGDYADQTKVLWVLFDQLVTRTADVPPRTTAFNEKEAHLASLALNQQVGSRSLRDLHGQNANLGIAEKLLNAELGQNEWLGEVDLERMLLKLGVKDRTHITRLNAEDIGMILHFERVKHGASLAPYSIPILINCGSSGSLRSQGSHWTYAMVNVNPATSSVTINYRDSMQPRGTEQAILTAAINYTDGAYSAFPDYANKTANVALNNVQTDGWSCGYRALHGLMTDPSFVAGQGPNWQTFINTANDSNSLRDVTYESLLSDLEISEDYFVAMKLDKEMVTSGKSETYGLDAKFTQHYLEQLSTGNKTKSVITTNHFEKEYNAINEELSKTKIKTQRTDSTARMRAAREKINKDTSLSPDAKIIALVDVFATEYATILKSSGGKNSELGKFIKNFSEKHFGVQLEGNQRYLLKTDGLIMRVLNDQAGVKASLLPPVKKPVVGPTQTSKSAPVVGTKKVVTTKVTPSVDAIGGEGATVGKTKLRTDPALSRLGTMFGTNQFCYGEKPGGVEPGFRAIDLDGVFFEELNRILSPEHIAQNTTLTIKERASLLELGQALQSGDLSKKQIVFSTFINSQVKGPHADGEINPAIKWLCDEVKGRVSKSEKLSAWMYKLDYADDQKERLKANKEAIREFVGTRLAGIFSAQNQKQEITWVNGKEGAHALLACGWKNGLQELRQFLHAGSEPDYNGVLVEDKNALVKHSKRIPGLGKNLIFGIAVGDRDGMGKDAQNKGFAGGGFYGFDYGKPYENAGVASSLKDDFSFADSYANYPAIFRGTSPVGLARHFMYRNYSVFYDTTLSERMEGFHLLKKMITGENPSEEVIKSYPGLRQELHRIQEMTPSPVDLLKQISVIRNGLTEGSPIQATLDNYIMQISTGKLTPFEFYFAKIKIDMIGELVQNGASPKEIEQYMTFIDEMSATAAKSNQSILNVFAQRALLTKPEIDLIDKLEKCYSPTSVMSHDGTVFLNTMRFDPPKERVPFQLKREENGNYTLSTTNTTLARQLKDDFNLTFTSSAKVLSCTVTPTQMQKLMGDTDKKYAATRAEKLVQPRYQFETQPLLTELLNAQNGADSPKATLEFTWGGDKSMSVRVLAKTEEQVEMAEKIFGMTVNLNEARIMIIPPGKHEEFQKIVADAYELEFASVSEDTLDSEVDLSVPMVELMPIRAGKWASIHQHSAEIVTPPLKPGDALIKRFEQLVRVEDTLGLIKDAIAEMEDVDIQKLMNYNDKTLASPVNIKAILEEKLADIVVIPTEELVVVAPGTEPGSGHQPTIF